MKGPAVTGRTSEVERNAGLSKAGSLLRFSHPWQFSLVYLSLVVSFALVLQAFMKETGWFPVSLHSALVADYSADPRGMAIPIIRIDIIQSAMEDNPGNTQPGELPPSGRYATLQAGLGTPVPMVTPLPGALPTFAEYTSTPDLNISPAPTEVEATSTTTPTASSTLSPSSTSMATVTSWSPTLPASSATPQPARTREPKPTSTLVPPTQPPPTRPAPTQPPRPTKTPGSYPPPYP